MIMGIGFSLLVAIIFFCALGLRMMLKDKELAFIMIKRSGDHSKIEVYGNLHQMTAELERVRRWQKPGSVKYID